MIIELQNLSKSFGSIHALRDVTLQLQAGCTGLLGSNGAGKSTMIKTLLGLVKPDSGSGTVLGCDIRKQSHALRLRAGYMPEHDCFFHHMNAVRYVSYAARLSGLPAVAALQRTHEMLDFVGLDEARYRALGSYSMGMKQRVKLAQAIVHDPELLFLDEPTNGMDPAGRIEMLDLVKQLHERVGMSVILCSHILPDVERVCDSVIVLHQGQLVAQKTMAEIRSHRDESWYVSAEGNVEGLGEKLKEAGIAFEVVSGREYRLIDLPESRRLDVLNAVNAAGARIKRFGQKSPSLEDVYLELVKSGESS